MDGLEFLDLVIGIVFVYFLLSMICASLQEIRASICNLRIKDLKKWIEDTFNKGKEGDTKLGELLWKNKFIDGLTRNGKNASYLPTTVFIDALLDEIHHDKTLKHNNTPYTVKTIKKSIEDSSLLPDTLKRMLLQFHSESFENLETFKSKIGQWFDRAMERNTGTYKKSAQLWVLLFSFLVTLSLNVDSIELATYFYENKGQAKRVADAAERTINDAALKEKINRIAADTAAARSADLDSIKIAVDAIRDYHHKLTAYGLPIGWQHVKQRFKDDVSAFLYGLTKVLGLIITGLAVSLGAPFWFDTLNKLVNLRSVGSKPQSLEDKKDKGLSASPETVLA